MAARSRSRGGAQVGSASSCITMVNWAGRSSLASLAVIKKWGACGQEQVAAGRRPRRRRKVSTAWAPRPPAAHDQVLDGEQRRLALGAAGGVKVGRVVCRIGWGLDKSRCVGCCGCVGASRTRSSTMLDLARGRGRPGRMPRKCRAQILNGCTRHSALKTWDSVLCSDTQGKRATGGVSAAHTGGSGAPEDYR